MFYIAYMYSMYSYHSGATAATVIPSPTLLSSLTNATVSSPEFWNATSETYTNKPTCICAHHNFKAQNKIKNTHSNYSSAIYNWTWSFTYTCYPVQASSWTCKHLNYLSHTHIHPLIYDTPHSRTHLTSKSSLGALGVFCRICRNTTVCDL